jgi:hypothetical protein
MPMEKRKDKISPEVSSYVQNTHEVKNAHYNKKTRFTGNNPQMFGGLRLSLVTMWADCNIIVILGQWYSSLCVTSDLNHK